MAANVARCPDPIILEAVWDKQCLCIWPIQHQAHGVLAQDGAGQGETPQGCCNLSKEQYREVGTGERVLGKSLGPFHQGWNKDMG